MKANFVKYTNTIKLMGTNPKQALLFSDACNVLANCINPTLKAGARKVILSTVISGKTFEFWLEAKWHEHNLEAQKLEKEIKGSSNLMTLPQTKKEFHFALVTVIVNELFNDYYHKKTK